MAIVPFFINLHPSSVSIPKRVSEVLWRGYIIMIFRSQLVSIPKRVSEVLWRPVLLRYFSNSS